LRHGLVVWWSELCGAARDVVVVVWWSTWSELGRAARDVVDVVVVGARQSCSGRGRRGLVVDVVGARRSCSLSGSLGLMSSERLVLVDEFQSNLKSLLLLFVWNREVTLR
jgi:hypothetical protein